MSDTPDHECRLNFIGGRCKCPSLWLCEHGDPLAEEERTSMRDLEREQLFTQLVGPLYARKERLLDKQPREIVIRAGRPHFQIRWSDSGLRQADLIKEAIEAIRDFVHSIYPCSPMPATKRKPNPGFHYCTYPSCDAIVSNRTAMCREHWLKMPREWRIAIYRSLIEHGAGTEAHIANLQFYGRRLELRLRGPENAEQTA